MKKIYFILLILLGVLMVGNLGYLDYRLIVNQKETGPELGKEEEREQVETPNASISAETCGESCRQLIAEAVKEEIGQLSLIAGQSGTSPVPKANGKTSTQAKTAYVPLITDGSVSAIAWTDIVPSEFYFDLSDYPGAKEVRFQAFLLSLNNDLVSSRLYDQTNKRGVDFSDLQTSSSTFTRIESSGIKIWWGNNKYTIQLRSVNGTQAQLKDAKLKIIY